ncbi:VWA domain-containing protein [Amaricoccus sp.]|uniref:vWA domain-containing protein n=1 Tax=Amaricoccus sp. TaxID=1872485 RepID=UPI001B6D69EF|nr:VWA domain-containing protein [Amaricoccus sp.]MBP7001661.1 VWA domain-containing protein [Amaricoccus sp.]
MARPAGLALVAEDGKLAANIVHFARALRKAGLPVGPGRVVDAVRAVEAAGFTDKGDFYHTLQACFVSRPEQREAFAQVFRLFWRDPAFMEHMMSLMLPLLRGVAEPHTPSAAERRAAEALTDGAEPPPPRAEEAGEEEPKVEFDATLTFSADERLRSLDFEQMSASEVAEAKRAIARLDLPVQPIASRRTRPDPRGQVADWRGTMRAALRSGGDVRRLATRARRTRWPNLVALCDISGSMSSYSRMLLHFLHAAANAKGAGWAQVHAFTFGTELTNITRHLRQRDVDAALAAAGREARDWEGGTRIGACLHDFNRDWSRRVLGQGAVVLLITDGLDRDDPGRLAAEMERLHLSARRVIWLNPLLRWEGFTPRAGGVRAILPHVDSFRACHSLASLEELVAALSRPEDPGETARLRQLAGPMRKVGAISQV